jgi:hypothetical protein
MNGRFRPRTPLAAALAGAAALLFGEFLYLQRRQEERAAAWVDQVVAARAEAARAHLARGDWDEALRLLRDALAVDGARDRDALHPLVRQAGEGQAGALLESARAALARRDVGRARDFLRAYAAHAHAPDPAAAARLRADLDRATDDGEARRLLGRLSDESLAFLAAGGPPVEGDWDGDEAVRPVFVDTLRRNLAGEQRRREARREAGRLEALRREEERARREARLRGTPLFRRLLAFTASARARLAEEEQLALRRGQALDQLFRQLDVQSPAERDRIRAGLTADRRAAREAFAEAVNRTRAEFKQAFRRSDDFSPDDAGAFDHLVDRELDALLRETGRP